MSREDELFERQRQSRIDNMTEVQWGAALKHSQLVQKFEHVDPHPEIPFEGGAEFPEWAELVMWGLITVCLLAIAGMILFV